MSDLRKNYDLQQMTWNAHDRAYHEESVEKIYLKVAEVVITQNERFFRELDKQTTRIDRHDKELRDHENRISRLERRYIRKVALVTGGILLGLTLLSFIIF